MSRIFSILGTMSGTSLDGVDVAHLTSDGEAHLEPGITQLTDYDEDDRAAIRLAMEDIQTRQDKFDWSGSVGIAHKRVTNAYIKALEASLANMKAPVDMISFHGQTITHLPKQGITVQIGDPQAVADALGIPVVCDLRQNDVANGGEGAPLAPVFHKGLMEALGIGFPALFLNIGGVSNVTYIDRHGDLLAFDTGPGNALMDDYMLTHFGERMDLDGKAAARGCVHDVSVVDHPFFAEKPPKSLDRLEFHEQAMARVSRLNPHDAMATLTHFTVETLGLANRWYGEPPQMVLASGGGVKNPVLMRGLAHIYKAQIKTTAEFGWDDVFIEANAWAYLAARHMRGLPISFPGTTGVSEPQTGGRLVMPA